MATSEIYLWKETGLVPSLNYSIENIKSYLDLNNATHIENFQFLELKPKMSIRIDLNQYNLQFDSNYDYDYCWITRTGDGFDDNDDSSDDGDKGAFYFIVGKRWKSKSCIEFELEMDVLNSFEWDQDYSVSDKTLVKRQSKDRYSHSTSFYYTNTIDLEAGVPRTVRIRTPIMAGATIKEIGTPLINGASLTPTYVPSTVSMISMQTEYYFKETGSCPTPLSAIYTTGGNQILFRRYNVSTGAVIESTYISRVRVDPSTNKIEVYKWENNSYVLYKSVDWTSYPEASGDNAGRWTIQREAYIDYFNYNTFCSAMAGTVTHELTYTRSISQNRVVEFVFTCTNTTTITFSFHYSINGYVSDVDLKSEGINPPLYKTNEVQFPDETGTTWSLLYKNQNTPTSATVQTNPVDCYLYPGRDLTITIPSTGPTLTSDNTVDTGWMLFFDTYNTPIPSFLVNNESLTPYYRSPTYMTDTYNIAIIAVKKVSNQVAVQYGVYGKHQVPSTSGYGGYTTDNFCKWTDKGSYTSISINTQLQSLKYHLVTSLPTTLSELNAIRPVANADQTVTLGTGVTEQTIKGKANIDRTDAKNVKLITLPYCPTNVSVTSLDAIVGNQWWYDSGTLKLRDLNTKFIHNVSTSALPLAADNVTDTTGKVLNGTASRSSVVYDPKLKHSDFYYRKFVYDSFSKIFKTECLDWYSSNSDNSDYHGFHFDFITSRNIVSKFLFMFPEYVTVGKGNEDYDNILPVARNNEEVLYNSQYLNYLRTGYNYDLKTKERNTAAGAAGLGISIASLIGSILLTATGYGAGVGVAGIVGSVAGIAGSSISLAKSTAQAEENIQRKLQESQNQAVSVSNADDYDLLEAYSGNQAKMCTYQVSNQMKNALNDMFYYAGYAVNEQYKPSIDIRYWFDFLQADLVIETSANLSKEIIELIKNKFSEGVTFFHCHKLGSDTTYTWDVGQQKENWEKWIVLANGGNA